MKRIVIATVIVLLSSNAFAQSSGSAPAPPPRTQTRTAASADSSLETPVGHEVNVSVASYTYGEPGDFSISIHGPKVGGEYTGTASLDRRRHWFLQANFRGTFGQATYDGWCSPWLILPNSGSPNGYELGLGDSSPCSETGDKDWFVDARALVGKDAIGHKWGVSPYAGLGVRHLSNGTTGIPGFRIDNYLYVPLGVTVRAAAGSRRVLGFNLEFDPLIRGWQTTHDSALGSGDVPATPTAPAFSIDGFTDVSFSQHDGWAVRASAKYQVNGRWSVEPYYIHWHVGDSPPSNETVTFTVNGITVEEQLGFYEPLNFTREFGVKVGFHF
jgi:hypothetical protein